MLISPSVLNYAICCKSMVENLTTSGCSDGNIHFFSAGPAIEIKNVDSSRSNRGIWSMRPSHKVLITDSFLHDNSADGVDLDSLSENVMIRNNRMANNGRAGVFIEEGASDNIVIGNHFENNSYVRLSAPPSTRRDVHSA